MDVIVLLVVVCIYIGLIALLGYIGYKKTKKSNDYLLGGSKSNPIIMALSYGATFISASAIVGFGGVAATFGMGIQWLCFLNMAVGVVIAFIFFGRPTRELGAKYNSKTFAQLLGTHFNSRTIQVFIAAVIFIGMPLYAAVVMKGGAVFIERMFDIDLNISLFIFTLIVALYVVTGGIKGVMYTDAMQAIIMFSCMFFMLFWFYKVMDMNFIEANVRLSEIKDLVPESLKAQGHRGWTSMPEFGSPYWYKLVTSMILGVGIGCLAQPQLVVRFMMVESTKQLNRGVLIGCLFLFITVGAIYHVSALSNLFFLEKFNKVAIEQAVDMDKIVPYFISEAMPSWFGALFMLCILSASMSTLSAQFHTMGGAIGADILSAKGKNATPIRIRIGVLISIFFSYVICYILEDSIIARGTALFMGVCASTFLPTYVAALYWKKATRRGAIASLSVGAFASIFVMLFVHKAESAPLGLCYWLFEKDSLIDVYPWFMIDPLIYALPLSIIALIVVSLLDKKTDIQP